MTESTIADWFSGLSIPDQKSMLDKLGLAHDKTVQAKRRELSAELSALGKRAGKKVSAKYRDPATKAEWAGRGVTPRWLSDYEAQGRKRDEFSI